MICSFVSGELLDWMPMCSNTLLVLSRMTFSHAAVQLSSVHDTYVHTLATRSRSEPLNTAPLVSPRMCINLKPYQFSCTCGTEVFRLLVKLHKCMSSAK